MASEAQLPERQVDSTAQIVDTISNVGTQVLQDATAFVRNRVADAAYVIGAGFPELGKLFDAGDKTAKPAQSPEDAAAEKRLREAAEKGIADPEQRKTFLADLEKFKERAGKDGLAKGEFAKTLDSVSKLLEAKDGKVGPKERELAAKGIMHLAGDPEKVCQGPHGTCGVASIEHKLYAKNPSVAADMVTQVALKGEFTGRDGQTIKIPPVSLEPGHSEKRGNYPPNDGERTFSSQLFQVTALNDIGQHLKPPMTFVQDKPKIERDKNSELVQENEYWLLEDGKTKKPLTDKGTGVFSRTGGIPSFLVANEVYRLTGEKQGILTNREFDKDDAPKEQRPPGITDDNMRDIRTKEQLEKTLQELKKEGKLPAEVSVHAKTLSDHFFAEFMQRAREKNKDKDGKDKFGDIKFETKPGDPDHFVTVNDYKPAADGKPAMVRIHNQWGSFNNGWVPLDVLMKSMRGGRS